MKTLIATTSATYSSPIQGVNTAGTVRVNNLAELEHVLNFVATTLEIALPLVGIYYIFLTASKHKDKTITTSKRVRGYILGVSLILCGLMIPGTMNLFVASGCGSLFGGQPVFQ